MTVAPAFFNCSTVCVVVHAIHCIPAAMAAATPAGASSQTKQSLGSLPKIAAAFKYPSG